LNKKLLVIAVTVLAVVVLATPLLGTVEACGCWRNWKNWKKPKVEVFIKNTDVDPQDVFYPPIRTITLGEDTLICDGTIRIRKGTTYELRYNGALGTGSVVWKHIIDVIHVGGGYFEFPPGQFNNVTGNGWEIHNLKFNITDGPYGAGTLSGIFRVHEEWDPSGYASSFSGVVAYGTGDLRGVKAYMSGVNLNLAIWFNTTVVS
jgi:hypothetical protein